MKNEEGEEEGEGGREEGEEEGEGGTCLCDMHMYFWMEDG